jgi:hypothetical protein
LAREIETGATVHAPLDQLEAVDLPLDGAVAPGRDDGGAHGWPVLPEPGDEAAEIGRGCSFQPRRQPGGIVLAQEVGEGASILGGLLQLRRGAAERFGEGAILPLQGGRVGGGPTGDAARRGDPSGR